MKTFTVGCAVLLSFLPSLVSAHGVVGKIVIGSKTYTGPTPYQSAIDSPIRQVSDVSPVKDLTSQDLACGQTAKPATLVANATAGGKVEIHWTSGDAGNWPHEVGPLMTYVAACANNDCTTDKAVGSKWIKIDEAGQKTPGANVWYQADLMAGKPYTVTLPASLPAGSYLMRHEIIALHNAISTGGAEFYPSCFQLQISGSGPTGASALAQSLPAADVGTFPGSYKADDKGILVPGIYNGKFDYSFPGPAIPSSFATSSAGNETESTSSAASPSDTASVSPSAAISTGHASPTAPVSVTTRMRTVTKSATSSVAATSIPADPTSAPEDPSSPLSSSIAKPTTTAVVSPSVVGGRVVVVTMTLTIPAESATGTASALPSASSAAAPYSAKFRNGTETQEFKRDVPAAHIAHRSRSKRAHRS